MSEQKQYVRSNQGQVDSREIDIKDAVQPVDQASAAGGVELDLTPNLRTESLDLEQFMRDELEVTFSEPGNENDPGFVEVTVNGDYRLLMRDGTPQKARRYHIAVIAQAKQSRVRQKKIVNDDGSMGFQEQNVLSLTYPFQVLSDPNPRRGAPWLRELLRAPG